MKKQNILTAYILIGIGVYFLSKQFDIPFLTPFYGWPTLLMIVGVALLLHSFRTKDGQNIFMGVIILGLGIQFHGQHNYAFWSDHWAIYILIIGIAFIIRAFWTKEGVLTGIILTLLASMFIFSWSLPHWLASPLQSLQHIHTLWPIVIIILGIYLLTKK